jgi:PA-IL-like protein
VKWVVMYLVLVAAIAGAKWQFGSKGSDMHWSSEVKDITVKAKPDGVWTWAIDYVKGPMRILVQANGTWKYSPDQKDGCGPDGDLTSLLTAENTLLPAAPVGALLMKIGGSTAGRSDGTVRVAGSKAYFEIDKTIAGPVFLTINDEPGGMVDNSGELKVTVSIAPLATPVSAPTPDKAAGDEETGSGTSGAAKPDGRTEEKGAAAKPDASKPGGASAESPKADPPKAAPKPGGASGTDQR